MSGLSFWDVDLTSSLGGMHLDVISLYTLLDHCSSSFLTADRPSIYVETEAIFWSWFLSGETGDRVKFTFTWVLQFLSMKNYSY